MPVVELSHSNLRKLVGRVSKKQIVESLPFLGLDIESIDKDVIKVEYSPNRPDYSTEFGIALGLQGLLGIKSGGLNMKIRNSKDYSIEVKPTVSKVRPYITGIIAKNGKIDDYILKDLISMQEDLHNGLGRKRKKSSIGIHDLDKISFPLVYSTVNREHTFVPLNEEKNLSIVEILEGTKVGKDYGSIIDSHSKVPIILDSNNHTVSFPPIINSSRTTVTTKTKNLFVEVTGLSKESVEEVLSVVATILHAMGFDLFSIKIFGAKNAPPIFDSKNMEIDISLINQMLGLDLDVSKVISCLRKSRLNALKKGKKITCQIPPYRFDILGPMDLVEEVALGYGIEKLSPVLSPSQTLGQKNIVSTKLQSLSMIMNGLGYMEVLNSCLTSKRVLYEMTEREGIKPISVLDSKSQEHTVLRDSILPNLLENLSRNVHSTYPQRLYETGTVFFQDDPIGEKINFGAVCAYRDANFTEVKSVLQSAFKTEFNLLLETKTISHPTFEKGRTASVLVNGKPIGIIGEINSEIIENYKIRVPVSGFDITLSGLLFD